jgi:hypothetical protein
VQNSISGAVQVMSIEQVLWQPAAEVTTSVR